LTGYIYLDT